MGINRMGPPCPNCGSLTTDVLTTFRTAEGDFVRRRLCPCCEHRFYTAQPCEVSIRVRSMTWKNRVPTIFWEDIVLGFNHILKKYPI